MAGSDKRLVYGSRCTWFGSIYDVGVKVIGAHKLPCCPHCGGMLLELRTAQEWWYGVDEYERAGHPGYRKMWEWARDQKKCFALGDRDSPLKTLEEAYANSQEKH